MSSILNLAKLRTLVSSPVHNRALVMGVSGVFALAGVLGWFFEAPGTIVAILWLIAAVAAGSNIAVRAFTALRNRSTSIAPSVTLAAVGAVRLRGSWGPAAVAVRRAVGGCLEARPRARCRPARGEVVARARPEGSVLRDGEERTAGPGAAAAGGAVVVRPGGRIAVEGRVLS